MEKGYKVNSPHLFLMLLELVCDTQLRVDACILLTSHISINMYSLNCGECEIYKGVYREEHK